MKKIKELFNRTGLKNVLLPFTLTRILLVIVGMISPLLLSLSYTPDPAVEARGWLVTPIRLIDMWARWDYGWYLGIVDQGYQPSGNIYETSNIAFYPVYPLLVKMCSLLLPSSLQTPQNSVLIGLIVSNLFCIAALAFLYKITKQLYSTSAAKKAVWLMCVFPTSFFLSSFYTESTFLFLSLVSIWAALKKNWGLAAIAASLLGATRVVGIFMAVPLTLMYLKEKNWSWKKFDKQALWFLVIPLGLIGFFLYLYLLTGDILASAKAQQAWGRRLSDPLRAILSPTNSWPVITVIDQIGVFSALSLIYLMFKEKVGKFYLPLGFYSLLITIPTLLTGTLDSFSRYLIVVFPLFQFLAWKLGRKRWLFTTTAIFLMVLQLYFFGNFSQFHWAG